MLKLLLLATATCLGLTGNIVYSDFGPGQTYNLFTSDNVSNGSAIAGGFTPSASGRLSQVDLALVNFHFNPPLYNLSILLESDSSGVPSGTVLDSWTLSHSSITNTPQIFTFTSSLSPSLTFGTPYWLIISSNAMDMIGYGWMQNSTGVTGMAINLGSGWVVYPSQVTPAFDVLASPVPEPSLGD